MKSFTISTYFANFSPNKEQDIHFNPLLFTFLAYLRHLRILSWITGQSSPHRTPNGGGCVPPCQSLYWYSCIDFILGPSSRHLGLCRRCGVAGCERVPPAPLGWYLLEFPIFCVTTRERCSVSAQLSYFLCQEEILFTCQGSKILRLSPPHASGCHHCFSLFSHAYLIIWKNHHAMSADCHRLATSHWDWKSLQVCPWLGYSPLSCPLVPAKKLLKLNEGLNILQ